MSKDLSYEKIRLDSKRYGNKKDYGIKTFVFNMNRHFKGSDQNAKNEIAIWLIENVDSGDWMNFVNGRLNPVWILLDTGFRNAHITNGRLISERNCGVFKSRFNLHRYHGKNPSKIWFVFWEV